MSVVGLDYASVDGNAPPDFAAAHAAGARFVIIRKSFVQYDLRGFHLTADPQYARDAQRARDAGLVVGSYGFVSFHKRAPSAAEQVATYCQAPGEVIAGRDLPPCIDVEFTGRGIADTGRTQAEAFAFLLELIAEVRKQFSTSPLIYTSHVQWHDTNGLGGPDAPELDGCPLWQKTPYRLAARQPVDRVPAREPHFETSRDDPHDYWRVPRPWLRQGWWLQQTQGDAVGFPGFSRTVDVDTFHPLEARVPDPVRVSVWQHHLSMKEPSLGALRCTGTWDAATDAAVRGFQARHGLVADGVIGLQTFAALSW